MSPAGQRPGLHQRQRGMPPGWTPADSCLRPRQLRCRPQRTKPMRWSRRLALRRKGQVRIACSRWVRGRGRQRQRHTSGPKARGAMAQVRAMQAATACNEQILHIALPRSPHAHSPRWPRPRRRGSNGRASAQGTPQDSTAAASSSTTQGLVMAFVAGLQGVGGGLRPRGCGRGVSMLARRYLGRGTGCRTPMMVLKRIYGVSSTEQPLMSRPAPGQ